MLSREEAISLLSSIGGAILGAYWAGAIGAGFGALIAWLIPYFAKQFTEDFRLKRKIWKSLKMSQLTQVRDLMKVHGIAVPIDCFPYDKDTLFVRSLAKYRKALLELEVENKVVYNKHGSSVIGYVDPPNDWVNEWSGRAYQKTPLVHN
jgi:hypothetical protein